MKTANNNIYMKKYILITISVLISISAFSQNLNYDEVENYQKVTEFSSYTSSTGLVFNVGEEITIGKPSASNGTFQFVTLIAALQAIDLPGRYAGVSYEIVKVLASGKLEGRRAVLKCKAPLGSHIDISIESAIKSGEVVTDYKTSEQAIEELKKAKEKLELELISQEEYDELKNNLAKYIE